MFIDPKIEENIINEDEDWERYRDDSFSISLRTCKEREVEKTTWMNENIAKDKIKITMECSQDEMVFLDPKIVVIRIADKKIVIITDCIVKKRTLTSTSAQIQVILRIKPKIHILEWLTEQEETVLIIL